MKPTLAATTVITIATLLFNVGQADTQIVYKPTVEFNQNSIIEFRAQQELTKVVNAQFGESNLENIVVIRESLLRNWDHEKTYSVDLIGTTAKAVPVIKLSYKFEFLTYNNGFEILESNVQYLSLNNTTIPVTFLTNSMLAGKIQNLLAKELKKDLGHLNAIKAKELSTTLQREWDHEYTYITQFEVTNSNCDKVVLIVTFEYFDHNSSLQVKEISQK